MVTMYAIQYKDGTFDTIGANKCDDVRDAFLGTLELQYGIIMNCPYSHEGSTLVSIDVPFRDHRHPENIFNDDWFKWSPELRKEVDEKGYVFMR